MKTRDSFRKVGFILSLGILALCPVVMAQWTSYVRFHYPPPVHYGDNAWASKILSLILNVQLVAAWFAVICAHGWKWRVAAAILAFAALFIGLCVGTILDTGITITNSTP
jgi:hypothetical protein